MADAPKFCIDESILFTLAANPAVAIASLEALLQLGEVIVTHKGGPPEIVQGVYGIPSNVTGRVFGDVLYQDILPVDRDFVRRIQVLIDRCTPFATNRQAPIAATLVVGAT